MVVSPTIFQPFAGIVPLRRFTPAAADFGNRLALPAAVPAGSLLVTVLVPVARRLGRGIAHPRPRASCDLNIGAERARDRR